MPKQGASSPWPSTLASSSDLNPHHWSFPSFLDAPPPPNRVLSLRPRVRPMLRECLLPSSASALPVCPCSPSLSSFCPAFLALSCSCCAPLTPSSCTFAPAPAPASSTCTSCVETQASLASSNLPAAALRSTSCSASSAAAALLCFASAAAASACAAASSARLASSCASLRASLLRNRKDGRCDLGGGACSSCGWGWRDAGLGLCSRVRGPNSLLVSQFG
mmetsp:Transcript_5350/g.14391  ORF Transcript_5350/g.14391 Transcript_5350/m.14391 type:complete len:220 (+) Transcript_5350:292-951(+)